MKLIRQGDVLLKRIKALPTKLVKKDKTLAFGEITGHHHSFAKVAQVQVFKDKGGKQFCEVVEDSVLEHQDHANVTVEKGLYEVTIQREFDIVEGVRQVAD